MKCSPENEKKNAHLPKLELEASLLVKYLDPVVVCVGHDDVVLGIDSHTAGLCELTLQDAELPKLAMVDHFLTPYLRLGRVDYGS